MVLCLLCPKCDQPTPSPSIISGSLGEQGSGLVCQPMENPHLKQAL